MRLKKMAIAFTAMAGLSGCDTFLLNIEPATTTPQTPQKIVSSFSQGDIYTSVFARANLNSAQNVVDACNSNFVANLVMEKQKNISVSAVLPSSSLQLPLYTVSSDGNNCQVKYSQMYLMTPQMLPAGAHYQITGNYEYDVKATQQVTQYIDDATKLAALFVPAAGTPILASVTSATSSGLGQQVIADANGAFSQQIGLAAPMLDFDSTDPYQRQIAVNWNVVASKIDNGTITTKTTLGSLAISIGHNTTLFGTETDDLPTYSDPLTVRGSQVVTLVPGGSTQQIQNVYDMVDTMPEQAASTVEKLDTGETASTVQQACRVLRQKLRDLGLNTYDRTAFLWSLYSQSNYDIHDHFGTLKSDCLVPAEMQLIKTLKQTIQPTPGKVVTLESWGRALD